VQLQAAGTLMTVALPYDSHLRRQGTTVVENLSKFVPLSAPPFPFHLYTIFHSIGGRCRAVRTAS